jgi:hypothetical protein
VLSERLLASRPEDEFGRKALLKNIRSDTEPHGEYVTAVGFRKVTVSGVGLYRRLEKRNVEKIAAGLITVGYIVTFPFAWQQEHASPRTGMYKDYIN